ncbi:hypothetical protein EOD39_8807 [Acipenser ruthenus]|uniref:Uncharacterized protein n=1 Tax=Acipenser ruthenus TaxID=7906 RepID=A0A444U2L0_ACIRT|nr:hypothetical protein EOD39_8807 [Acipenser ruthenus]
MDLEWGSRGQFGHSQQPGLLRTELWGWTRKAGVPLYKLAAAIKDLTCWAFVHMPSLVQEELAWDQFVEALEPGQLQSKVHLLHPQSFQEELEMAHKRGSSQDEGYDSCVA